MNIDPYILGAGGNVPKKQSHHPISASGRYHEPVKYPQKIALISCFCNPLATVCFAESEINDRIEFVKKNYRRCYLRPLRKLLNMFLNRSLRILTPGADHNASGMIQMQSVIDQDFQELDQQNRNSVGSKY